MLPCVRAATILLLRWLNASLRWFLFFVLAVFLLTGEGLFSLCFSSRLLAAPRYLFTLKMISRRYVNIHQWSILFLSTYSSPLTLPFRVLSLPSLRPPRSWSLSGPILHRLFELRAFHNAAFCAFRAFPALFPSRDLLPWGGGSFAFGMLWLFARRLFPGLLVSFYRSITAFAFGGLLRQACSRLDIIHGSSRLLALFWFFAIVGAIFHLGCVRFRLRMCLCPFWSGADRLHPLVWWRWRNPRLTRFRQASPGGFCFSLSRDRRHTRRLSVSLSSPWDRHRCHFLMTLWVCESSIASSLSPVSPSSLRLRHQSQVRRLRHRRRDSLHGLVGRGRGLWSQERAQIHHSSIVGWGKHTCPPNSIEHRQDVLL